MKFNKETAISIAILAAVILVVFIVFYFVYLKDWIATRKEEKKAKNDQAQAKTNTGVDPTLTSDQADKLANSIYDTFSFFNDDEDSLDAIIMSIQNPADWDLLVTRFGEKACKKGWRMGHGEESLPAMILRHHPTSHCTMLRNHLTSIGVANPGF